MKLWKNRNSAVGGFPKKRKSFIQSLQRGLKPSPSQISRNTSDQTEISTDTLSRNGYIMNEMNVGDRNQRSMKDRNDRPSEDHRSVEMRRLSEENKILKAQLLNVKSHNKKLVDLCKKHNIQDDLLKTYNSSTFSSFTNDKITTHRQVFASMEEGNTDKNHDKNDFHMEEQIIYSSKTRRMSNLSWETNESMKQGNTDKNHDKNNFNMEEQINYSSKTRRMSNLSWESYLSENEKNKSQNVRFTKLTQFPETIMVKPELRLSDISEGRSKKSSSTISAEPRHANSFIHGTAQLIDVFNQD